MNLIGNIIWLIFGGIIASIVWFIAGFILCVSVIGLPSIEEVALELRKYWNIEKTPISNMVELLQEKGERRKVYYF